MPSPDSKGKFFSNMQINGVLSLFLDGNSVNDFSLAVDHVQRQAIVVGRNDREACFGTAKERTGDRLDFARKRRRRVHHIVYFAAGRL